MRKTDGGGDAFTPSQNGTSAHHSSEEEMEEAAGSSGVDPAQAVDLEDPQVRREIRTKYRTLMLSVQDNKELMLNLNSDRLSHVLVEADLLFKDVRQAREAALDSQLLVLASDLGKESASLLLAERAAFDPNVFAQHLLTFMGLNRLESAGEGLEDEDDDGFLPEDAWQRLADRATCCFKTVPSFHYMMGSFLAEPPVPKQRTDRQRREQVKEVKQVMPKQLKKMEVSHEEATEKEVERILGFLRRYHAEDPTSPISYYEFVIDPTSFPRTVENMFHVSFLIRDGLARIYLDEKLPCIAPVEKEEEEVGGAPSPRRQCVISINLASWREIIEVFDISEPLIPPPSEAPEVPSTVPQSDAAPPTPERLPV